MINDYNTKLFAANKELEHLSSELATFKDKSLEEDGKLADQTQKYQQEKADVIAKLTSEMEATAQKKDHEIAKLAQKLDENTQGSKGLEAQLRKELEQAKKEHEEVKKEHEQVKKEHEETKFSLDNFKNEKSVIDTQLETLRKSDSSKDEEIKLLKNEIESLKSMNSKLMTQSSAASTNQSRNFSSNYMPNPSSVGMSQSTSIASYSQAASQAFNHNLEYRNNNEVAEITGIHSHQKSYFMSHKHIFRRASSRLSKC